MTAPTCADLFTEPLPSTWEERLKAVAARYNDAWEAYENRKIFYPKYESYKRKLNDEFKRLLEAGGLKVRYYEYDWTGFEILPEGSHPLAKLAESVSRSGIRLRASPFFWTTGASGAYDGGRRILDVDIETIITGRLSLVIVHELRHAQGNLRSRREDGVYDRILQADLKGDLTPERKLPEMTGAYASGFSLDEIPAHRQSAIYLLRDLKKNPSDKWAISGLKTHGERLKLFVVSGVATLKALKGEVEAADFKFSVNESSRTPTARVYFEVTESGYLSRWFRKDIQDKNLVGLAANFMFLKDELPEKESKRSIRKLLLSKIDITITELEVLRPAVEKIYEATEALERATEKELKEVEDALNLLTKTFAQRRKALQEKPENSRPSVSN